MERLIYLRQMRPQYYGRLEKAKSPRPATGVGAGDKNQTVARVDAQGVKDLLRATKSAYDRAARAMEVLGAKCEVGRLCAYVRGKTTTNGT